eukprot:766080-Prymnesium_polylepis.2
MRSTAPNGGGNHMACEPRAASLATKQRAPAAAGGASHHSRTSCSVSSRLRFVSCSAPRTRRCRPTRISRESAAASAASWAASEVPGPLGIGGTLAHAAGRLASPSSSRASASSVLCCCWASATAMAAAPCSWATAFAAPRATSDCRTKWRTCGAMAGGSRATCESTAACMTASQSPTRSRPPRGGAVAWLAVAAAASFAAAAMGSPVAAAVGSPVAALLP